MSQTETQFGVTPKIHLRIKPCAIRNFYCRICVHQYTHTTLDQHVVTLGHMNNLIKRQGCLL